jgi:hypothetical protein
MIKERVDLEGLVHIHAKKRHKAKHYSRQLTMVLAVVCLAFFGTIVSYDVGTTQWNSITGMAMYASDSAVAESAGVGASNLVGFVTAVKTSPHVTEYKLFFYTMWILVVLVGSAVYYEYDR